MTERCRRRKAGFAGVDLTAIFGCETTEVENLDAHAGLLLQFLFRSFHHAVAFRHFAGARMLTAGGTVDQQKSERTIRIFVAMPGCVNCFAGRNPIQR